MPSTSAIITTVCHMCAVHAKLLELEEKLCETTRCNQQLSQVNLCLRKLSAMSNELVSRTQTTAREALELVAKLMQPLCAMPPDTL